MNISDDDFDFDENFDDSFADADLGKFLEEDDDGIKPIDSPPAATKKKTEDTTPPAPDEDDPNRTEPSLADGYDAFLNAGSRRTSTQNMKDRPAADSQPAPTAPAANPGHIEGGDLDSLPPVADDEDRNYIRPGEYFDLLEYDQTLKNLVIAAGWDQKKVDEDPVDIDISLFLLDKNDQTRIDEDFVFYNNKEVLEGAIKHQGDSRTGAGDGDDESVLLELSGIPFDILKIMIVLSIYDEDLKGDHFSMVRNMFVRLVNADDNNELVCFKINEEDCHEANAIYAATLIREGARWVFEAFGKATDEGLSGVAQKYGLIIKEMQSTGMPEQAEESSQP